MFWNPSTISFFLSNYLLNAAKFFLATIHSHWCHPQDIHLCILSSHAGLFFRNNLPFLLAKPPPSCFLRPSSTPSSLKSISWFMYHLTLVIPHLFNFHIHIIIIHICMPGLSYYICSYFDEKIGEHFWCISANEEYNSWSKGMGLCSGNDYVLVGTPVIWLKYETHTYSWTQYWEN